MSKHLKHSITAIVVFSLILSSCTTIRHTSTISEVPGSRKLLSYQYICDVHELPSADKTHLIVSFEKVNQYEFQQLEKEFKELNNKETRVAGWGTILFGAILGGAVALGGSNEDGTYNEPNPEAGRDIFIGSLILGGVLSIIPDSKTETSSAVTTQTIEESEPIQVQDSLYTIWSSIYPEKVIERTLVDEAINLDVVADLGLDYIENTDSIQVYFRSGWDETLTYTVDFKASDYLKRYLNTKEVSDSISLYQAPNINAPVIGQLAKEDALDFLEEKEQWYKVTWKERKVYLKSERIEYFFARQ